MSAAICAQPFRILGQQRLLDEQQPERLQHLGELLGQRPVDAAVEVEPDVHALRLRRLDPLHDLVEQLRRADPVELGGRVHLDRGEALRLARPAAASAISCGRSPPIQA